MDKNILDFLPNEIKDNIYDFVGYKEQYDKVILELKTTFKVYNMLVKNNIIQVYYINHYVYFEN